MTILLMTIQEEEVQTEDIRVINRRVEGIPGSDKGNNRNEDAGNVNYATSPVFTNELFPSDAERHRSTMKTTANRRASPHHLAEGFSKSDQLKILYLYQCFNLQKILKTKLNRFGRNQITRYSTLRAKTGKMDEPVNRELNVTRS